MRWLVKTTLLVAALLVGVGNGYSDESRPRPFSGTWNGEVAIIGNCEDGTLLVSERDTGVAEHTGNSTYVSTYCMDPVNWTATGVAVLTAANGDQIYASIALRLVWTSPSTGYWFESETWSGGTGRFTIATGSTTSSGTFWATSATTFALEGTHTGTLSY